MRYLALNFIALVSFLFCSNTIAAPTKYAVVDIDKILAQSESYKNFKNSWDQANSRYQKEIEFYEKEIAKNVKLLSGSKSLTVSEANDLKYKLGQYETKIQQLVQTRKINMDEQFGITLEKLRNKVNKLIEKYAKEHNIAMILGKSQTVYIVQSLDITDSIIAGLDKDERR